MNPPRTQPPETQGHISEREDEVLQSMSVCISSRSCNDIHFVLRLLPVPVAVRSTCKARVCGRSLAGTAGSDPAGAWLSVLAIAVFCQAEVSAVD